MQDLTYGRKRPESTDISGGADGWFQALADNADLDDAHDHDGEDSAKLAISAVVLTTQSVAAASWANPDSNGMYSQVITIPPALVTKGLTFGLVSIRVRDANNEIIFPKIKKLTDTTFTIYTNDNTQAWTLVYTT